MKTKLNYTLLLAFFALLTLSSCQKEVIEITQPNEDQVIAPQSTLAGLMKSTSSNNGASDDIMDNANCLSVHLPVTIVVNGITITIETEEDLDFIRDVFEEFNDDEDTLEFIFPITIVLSNHTEVVIESMTQLESFIDSCDTEEVIECVDFKYPMSFSIYNTDFQVIETVVIESDRQLYQFMERIEDANEAILASLNFPVKMIFANGEIVEVFNNNELENVINEAEGMCDNDDDCSKEDIVEDLMECQWKIFRYNGDDHLRPYHFTFMENGQLKIIKPDGTMMVYGEWSARNTDNGVILNITELNTFDENLSGEWLVEECDDDRLQLKRENNTTGTTTMVIKQRCENEPDCTAQEIQRNLMDCSWFAGTNVYSNAQYPKFVFNENGSVTVVDREHNIEVSGTWEVALTDYGIKLILELPQPYGDLSGYWKVYECAEGRIKVIRDNYYMVFEKDCDTQPDCTEEKIDSYLIEENCHWVPVSIGGSNDFNGYDFYFNANQDLVIKDEAENEIVGTWSTNAGTGTGTVVGISQIAAPFEPFNKNWVVAECGAERIVLVNDAVELVLEKECQ